MKLKTYACPACGAEIASKDVVYRRFSFWAVLFVTLFLGMVAFAFGDAVRELVRAGDLPAHI